LIGKISDLVISKQIIVLSPAGKTANGIAVN
jgi:hypothetical protein